MDKGIGVTMSVLGFTVWAVPYVYTLIKAPKLVEEHNQQLAQERFLVRPLLFASDRGLFVGVGGSF
jgi:hypothetical protein